MERKVSRSERYNQSLNECEWPIDLRESKVKSCKFNFIMGPTFQYRKKTYQLVILPKETKLYHGTLVVKGQPIKLREMIWLTSTLAHQGNFNSTHIFEFIVKEPLVLVFEPNLSLRYGSSVRGFEYKPILKAIQLYHQQEFKKSIDGYIGCNECEIGLFVKSFLDKVDQNPKVVREKSLKYI